MPVAAHDQDQTVRQRHAVMVSTHAFGSVVLDLHPDKAVFPMGGGAADQVIELPMERPGLAAELPAIGDSGHAGRQACAAQVRLNPVTRDAGALDAARAIVVRASTYAA